MSTLNADDLAAAIRKFSELEAGEMRVCLPGVVTEYNEVTRMASVQPTLKRPTSRRYPNAVELPIVHGCAVVFPGAWLNASYFLMEWPIEKGTTGDLIFTDWSLESWSISNGTISTVPTEPVSHSISNARFIPGTTPQINPYPKGTGKPRIVVSDRAGVVQSSIEIDMQSLALSASQSASLDAPETTIGPGSTLGGLPVDQILTVGKLSDVLNVIIPTLAVAVPADGTALANALVAALAIPASWASSKAK